MNNIPKNQNQDNHCGSHDVLYIYPAYTELKSRLNNDKNMNISNPDFNGFKPYREKTRKELNKREKFRFSIKSKEEEYRSYIQPPTVRNKARSKRGFISEMSKKASIRCRKTACRLPLTLWIDFTFPDDIYVGLNHDEIRKKCNEILNRFQRYLKGRGYNLFWKREWKPRKSGRLKGIMIPHFHTFLIGLTDEEKKRPEVTIISLFQKWVETTETLETGKALGVCLRREKDGSPASYRFITSLKAAIKYVSKYFAKPETFEGYEPQPIGRTWGYSKGLREQLAYPIQVTLDQSETNQIRRRIRKALKLRKSKSFQKTGLPYYGLREQLLNNFTTFVFIPENTIMRLINLFVPDPFKTFYSDEVPF